MSSFKTYILFQSSSSSQEKLKYLTFKGVKTKGKKDFVREKGGDDEAILKICELIKVSHLGKI